MHYYTHFKQCPMSCHQLIHISHTTHTLSARTVQTAVLFSMKPVRAVSNTSRLILFMPRSRSDNDGMMGQHAKTLVRSVRIQQLCTQRVMYGHTVRLYVCTLTHTACTGLAPRGLWFELIADGT
jgi:hypothetical protein